MTTILHIFRKDLRHLWPYATAVWVLMAASALLDPTYANRGESFSFNVLAGFALPLAFWLLLIAAIHEEKLPGDRQYWLTRPYQWKDLLGAKLLLVAMCVNLPLFLWHVSACLATGIPVWEHLPALLWRQFFFSAIYLLPLAAMASITRSLGQVILTAIVVLLPLAMAEAMLVSRLRLAWIGMESYLIVTVAAILVAGVAAVLCIQYSSRATKVSRFVAAGVGVIILGVAFSAGWLPRLVAPRQDRPAIHISLSPQAGKPTTMFEGTRGFVTLEIPVRVDGVPQGVDLLQKYISLTINGDGHRSWNTQRAMDNGFHDINGGAGGLTVYIPAASFQWIGTHASLRGSASFLAFGHQQFWSLPKEHPVVIPKVGVCSSTHDSTGSLTLICYSPDPRASVTIGATRNRLNWIIPQGMVDTAIPTSIDFQPLVKYTSLLSYKSWDQIGTTQLMTAQPLPPIEVEFELPDVDLSQYVRTKLGH